MWGLSSNYPSISSYGSAARVYTDTKPLRGRPDFRPLDARSSRAKSQIIKDGDDYVIRLYRTDIIRYKPDGSVVINHGGWVTPSTAGAISAMSPFTSWCRKGYLVVTPAANRWYSSGQAKYVVLNEGLVFDPQGIPQNPPAATIKKKRVKKDEAKRVRALFKEVPKYIETFCALYRHEEPTNTPWFRLQSLSNIADLSDEDAARLALNYLEYDRVWDYGYRNRTDTAHAQRSLGVFWREAYQVFSVIETYEIELPIGEVP
jgi:hypothetical protein